MPVDFTIVLNPLRAGARRVAVAFNQVRFTRRESVRYSWK